MFRHIKKIAAQNISEPQLKQPKPQPDLQPERHTSCPAALRFFPAPPPGFRRPQRQAAFYIGHTKRMST